MKVFFTYAGSADVSDVVHLRDSIYTTPGVDSKHLGANIVSADLAVAVVDGPSGATKDVTVAIHVRMALQKPIMIFHPLGFALPIWIWEMRRRMYVNNLHDAPIIFYSILDQVTDAFEKYVRTNLRPPTEARRVVF